LDIYRLVCLVLADKPVAKLGKRRLTIFKDQYVRPEVTRILISTAVALRIRFDRNVAVAERALPQTKFSIRSPE
jgi:hypothetical protein